jgi:hypothetical protein
MSQDSYYSIKQQTKAPNQFEALLVRYFHSLYNIYKVNESCGAFLALASGNFSGITL